MAECPFSNYIRIKDLRGRYSLDHVSKPLFSLTWMTNKLIYIWWAFSGGIQRTAILAPKTHRKLSASRAEKAMTTKTLTETAQCKKRRCVQMGMIAGGSSDRRCFGTNAQQSADTLSMEWVEDQCTILENNLDYHGRHDHVMLRTILLFSSLIASIAWFTCSNVGITRAVCL